MRKLVGAFLLLSLTTALLSGGRELIGRLFLSAGMPATAAELLQDPTWKGVALYSAQRWNEAAEAFRTSGAPGSVYNFGNALAQSRRYAEALAAYDKALEQDAEDDDARTNRATVAALLQSDQTHASERINGSAGSPATKQRDKDDTGASGQDASSTGPEGMAGMHEVASTSGSAGGALKRASATAVHSFAAIHGQSMGSGTNNGGIGQGDAGRRTLLEDSLRMGKPVEAKSVQADTQWLKTLPDDPGGFLKLRLAAEHNRRVDAGTAPPITGDPW